jgi:biotin carboxyl carrier protein
MQVQSPKDGFVAQLSAADGTTVSAGSTLLVLDSVSEDLRVARLKALDQLRTIFAQRLSDQAVQIARSLAQIPSQIAAASTPELTTLRDQAIGGEILGTQALGTANTIKNQLATLQGQADQGTNDLTLTNMNLDLANRVNTIIGSHLKSEMDTATLLKHRTIVVADISGKVSYKVKQGLFVRRGQTLLTIGDTSRGHPESPTTHLSPKDGIVTSIVVSDGASVAKDDVVLTIFLGHVH